MLTTNEVADRLKVSTRTVRNLIESGELKAIKLIRDYRIEENDLNDFINNRKLNNDEKEE